MDRREFIIKGGKVLITASILGTGLVSLTGCSSEEETKSATDGSKAKELPTLKIGYLPITDHLTMLAHNKVTFKNLKLEPVKFASWPELSEALKANAIHGAFALTPIGMKMKKQGVPIKAVLLGHRNGSAITVKVGDEIKSIADLKGSTIAIPSKFSTHNILIRKILTESNINPDKDLKLIDMAPPEMVQALSGGQVNGFIVAEPFGAQAELQNIGKVLILSKDIWKDHICCVLNLREEVITEYPDAVQELVNGFVATGKFIEANKSEAAELSTKYFGQKPEVIKYVLTKPADRVTYNNLLPAMEEFEATQNYMLQFGITPDKLDLSTYVDLSYAKKAYQA